MPRGRSHPGAGLRRARPRGCGFDDPSSLCHFPSCYLGYFAAFWSLLQRVAAGCMGKRSDFSKSKQALPAGCASGTQGAGRQLLPVQGLGIFPLPEALAAHQDPLPAAGRGCPEAFWLWRCEHLRLCIHAAWPAPWAEPAPTLGRHQLPSCCVTQPGMEEECTVVLIPCER